MDCSFIWARVPTTYHARLSVVYYHTKHPNSTLPTNSPCGDYAYNAWLGVDSAEERGYGVHVCVLSMLSIFTYLLHQLCVAAYHQILGYL